MEFKESHVVVILRSPKIFNETTKNPVYRSLRQNGFFAALSTSRTYGIVDRQNHGNQPINAQNLEQLSRSPLNYDFPSPLTTMPPKLPTKFR